MAAADHNGKLFVIDLQVEKYWQLPEVGPLNFISFPVLKKSELLISLTSAALQFIDIENGTVTGFLNGHSFSATDISYSDDGRYCLTSCSTEAIIWDLQTNTQAYRLSVKVDMNLKKVLFMPVSNNILACFQDDAMHIWKFGTFECIKQIIPESWKTHHLKSIALTKNGRAMVIGGHTLSLVVFCLDTWIVKKVIEFPESIPGVKQIEFVPQIFDGGANKILALLTNSLGIYFLDVETSTFLKSMHRLEGLASKMVVSPTGKYFASVLISGEVNIYTTLKVLEGDLSRTPVEIERSGTGLKSTVTASTNQRQGSRNKTMQSNEALSTIDKQIKETLTLKKLLPILKEFGEYPDSYRVLIWKTILQLPMNQEAYRSLASKECYPSYGSLEAQYPLVNKSLLNTLKRLLSNLSHWCPLFGEVGFLPEFVFPFVKVFHFDPFVCFEAVATIIVNWCQNWFEFYPFPPINTLAMIENVLAYHDPELLEFYYKETVTSSLYACTVLQTILSEVLSKCEWLRLWDHVISNEPAFLLMAVVAYNVVCRNAIKSCENTNDIELFFHNQIAIDMKMLISKSYYFLNNTPDDIHPRQYLAPFRPLAKGGAYTAYEGYPKIIVDPNARKLQDIHKEEEEILKEQRKAIAIKKELDKKLQAENRVEVREEILKELDEKFRKIVDEEEGRIQTQRRKLQNLRQELKLKELAVLETARDRALKQRAERKKIELDRLVTDISKKKMQERIELELAEDEIKRYYSELLARKSQLEVDLKYKEDETTEIAENLRRQQQKLRNELHNLQNETATLHQSKHIEIAGKVAAIKDLLQNVEVEIAKELAEKDVESCVERNRIQLVNLKEETRSLEGKVDALLNKQLRIEEGGKKSVEEILLKSSQSQKNDTRYSLSFEDSRTRWSTAQHHTPDDDQTDASIELIRRKLPHKKTKSLETLSRKSKATKSPRNHNRELIRKASGDQSDLNPSSFSDSNDHKKKSKKKYHVNYAVANVKPFDDHVCKCTSECAFPCTLGDAHSSLREGWISKLGLEGFENKDKNLEGRRKISDKESSSEYHSITNESSQSRCSICHERIESSVKKKDRKGCGKNVRRRFCRSAEDLNSSVQKDHSFGKSASEDEVIRAALSVRRRLIEDAKRFSNFNR